MRRVVSWDAERAAWVDVPPPPGGEDDVPVPERVLGLVRGWREADTLQVVFDADKPVAILGRVDQTSAPNRSGFADVAVVLAACGTTSHVRILAFDGEKGNHFVPIGEAALGSAPPTRWWELGREAPPPKA